jgi:hypothetical protein
MSDKYGIICNFAVPTKTSSTGSKAWLGVTSGGAIGDGNVRLYMRSRGDRMIEKWDRIKRLTNFRIATLPPEHPFYKHEKVTQFETRAAAEEELSFILRVFERESGLPAN